MRCCARRSATESSAQSSTLPGNFKNEIRSQRTSGVLDSAQHMGEEQWLRVGLAGVSAGGVPGATTSIAVVPGDGVIAHRPTGVARFVQTEQYVDIGTIARIRLEVVPLVRAYPE